MEEQQRRCHSQGLRQRHEQERQEGRAHQNLRGHDPTAKPPTRRLQLVDERGPEKLEGVISEINKDFVSLISKEEVVRVSMWHIRNISYGLKVESEKQEESKDQGKEENTMSQTEKQVVRQRVVRAENSQVRQ